LVVVAPVYDDAVAAARLLENLQRAFAGANVSLRVLLIDDGSPVPLSGQLQLSPGAKAEVLRLRRNVGHQRAIALAAAYVHDHLPCDAMIVMDADGEDRPEDAATLVTHCRASSWQRIVFAERSRRSESALFQVCYRLYQLLHWLLTGVRVRVGNFSVVPASRLGALVTLPALWNHYAAAVFQARLPRELVPIARGTRYSGGSKMNFVSLVVHGLQAISVFVEVVAVRLLFLVCLVSTVCAGLLGLALATPALAAIGAPAWTAYALGGLTFTSICVALGSFGVTLGLLAQRNSLDFIPARDYAYFVEGFCQLPKGSDAEHTPFQEWRGRSSPVLRPEGAQSPLQP
jgi:hypothetical protein